MGVDGSIASCAGQVLVLPVWDVDVRLGVAVLLRQAKVDDVDLVGPLAQPHEEVVWLDIPVDEALRVHVLDPRDLHRHSAIPFSTRIGSTDTKWYSDAGAGRGKSAHQLVC